MEGNDNGDEGLAGCVVFLGARLSHFLFWLSAKGVGRGDSESGIRKVPFRND